MIRIGIILIVIAWTVVIATTLKVMSKEVEGLRKDLTGQVYPIAKVDVDKNVLHSKITDRYQTPDGQWCFVTVVIKQEGDEIVKKEVLECSDTKQGQTQNEKIKELEKQIELEKARKPGYWELFAEFYYRDPNAPVYCRKYARPDSWFKRPGTVCLDPQGKWEVIN